MKAKLNTFDMNRINLWEQVPLDTPFQLCIEPTFICNFRCDYCMHALDKETLESRGFRFAPMAWSDFEAIVEQLQEFPHNIKKVCFTGFGEPLLDDRLPKMIQMVMETGKVDKTLVITNGSLLTNELSDRLIESGLSELKISLQGMKAEKYRQVCGVKIDFDKFLENIRYFSSHRKQCVLRLKIADVALEEGEEREFYNLFGDLCDFVAIEHIYPQFRGVNAKVIDGTDKNRFGFPFTTKQVCSTLFFKLNILQRGQITFGYPDGVTYDGFTVRDMTLLQAWNSPERKRLLLDNLRHDFSMRKCCETCLRWAYSVTPEDDIDGHEAEILERLDLTEYEVPYQMLKKENIICYDGA
nr:radical SAM protein [uncultured Oscillibacter sp.]